MFAPPGYHSFEEVVDFCQHVATSAWATQIHLHGVLNEEAGEGRKRFLEPSFLTAWLLCKCLSELNPSLCSPTGLLLEPSQRLLFHEDRLSWYEWSWPVQENEELRLPFEKYWKGKDNPFDRFRFIDPITGTISVVSREAQILKFAYDEDEYALEQLKVARQFDGWAICFPRNTFPPNERVFAEILGLNSPMLEFTGRTAGNDRKIGRPYLQDQARQAYFSAFPEGHGDISWSAVEDRVAELARRRISAKTIRRAIAPNLDNLDKTPTKN